MDACALFSEKGLLSSSRRAIFFQTHCKNLWQYFCWKVCLIKGHKCRTSIGKHRLEFWVPLRYFSFYKAQDIHLPFLVASSECQKNANPTECLNPNQSQLINWRSVKQCDLTDTGIMTSQGRAKWWKDSLQTQWKLSCHLQDPIYNVESLEVVVKTNHLKLSENPDIITLIIWSPE